MSDTLAAPLRHEQLVKHSRFLVQAGPVASADDAMAFSPPGAGASTGYTCSTAFRIRSHDQDKASPAVAAAGCSAGTLAAASPTDSEAPKAPESSA